MSDQTSDFLKAYSIQSWLESAPQGYLEGTQYGHPPEEKESERILNNPEMRQRSIRTTSNLVAGERCALAASAGLVACAPDEPSQCFLATQTLDEARHVEIFKQRLLDLGVKKAELEDTIAENVSPDLVKFAEVLLEKVEARDFVAGVVGQNIVLEGMAFHVFETIHAGAREHNPKFAHTLEGTIADERRHVGFGENRIGSLIQQHPEKKPAIQKMQTDMSSYMLKAIAGMAPPRSEPQVEERVGALSNAILHEFQIRLKRVGLEFQDPRA